MPSTWCTHARTRARIYVEWLFSRLTDAQAQLRAAQLKWRDGAFGRGRLLVVLGDSAANRRAIAGIRDLLRDDFPLDTGRFSPP